MLANTHRAHMQCAMICVFGFNRFSWRRKTTHSQFFFSFHCIPILWMLELARHSNLLNALNNSIVLQLANTSDINSNVFGPIKISEEHTHTPQWRQTKTKFPRYAQAILTTSLSAGIPQVWIGVAWNCVTTQWCRFGKCVDWHIHWTHITHTHTVYCWWQIMHAWWMCNARYDRI